MKNIDVKIDFHKAMHKPEIYEIEKQSWDFPWSEEDFSKCFRQRNSVCNIAEYEERVAGFIVVEMHKSRYSILNLAVHPEFRRRSVATQLVLDLAKKLSFERRNRILLEVRETNLAAQLFFARVTLLQCALFENFTKTQTKMRTLCSVFIKRKSKICHTH